MSERLHILLSADGRSPHTSRWANWLADRGHDVVVVWLPEQNSPAAREAYREAISHVDAAPAPLVVAPRSAFAARRRLRRLGSELRPDVVHGLYLQVHGWTAADLGRRPLLVSALGSDAMSLLAPLPRGLKPRLVELLSRRRTIRMLRAADAVLCDSETIAAHLRSVAGVEPQLVRFGVERMIGAADARRRWRERLDVDVGAPLLLSTRLLKPLYNIDLIVEAFARVLEAQPDAVLVVKDYEPFGDADYRRRCLELVGRHGIGNSVRVIGELPRDELLGLYAASDVYVSVPSTDGTAVSIFEAMAAGSAVVAADAPGIDKSILRDGETCVLVPVRDAPRLAEALDRVLRDSRLRSRLVGTAARTVAELGDFDEELSRAERLYTELACAVRER